VGGVKIQLVGNAGARKIEKVTGSQDDGFVVSWRCKKQRLVGPELVVGMILKSDCWAAPIVSAHVRQGEDGHASDFL
jgi:hypothetical protein